MRPLLSLLLAGLLPAAPLSAQYVETEVQAYFAEHAAKLGRAEVVLDAIRDQNLLTADYSRERITQLDAEWQDNSAAGRSLIDRVLEGRSSAYLRDLVEESGGEIAEIIVMDARGLNVAASMAPSDYWQGDEAKFTETFRRGPGATHIGAVEYDESSRTHQLQVSRTLIDPETRAPIGAVTLGLAIDALL